MPRSPGWSRFLLAGGLLGALEVLLVLATERDMFLSSSELARYAALALGAYPLLVALLGVGGGALLGVLLAGLARFGASRSGTPMVDAVTLELRVRRAITLAAWPALSYLAWLLTAGRRARELPGRTALVIGVGLGAAYVLGRALSALLRAQREARTPRRVRVLLVALAVAALLVDMYALRRLYPAFHAALGVSTVVATAVAAATWPSSTLLRMRSLSPLLCVLSLALAGYGAHGLSTAPNARFAVTQVAPLTGKLLRAGRRLGPHTPGLPSAAEAARATAARAATAAAAAAAAIPPAPGLDLRGRDVLLVTIDALRADRLGAYGSGARLTPALDALAAESAVFERAYTPTPHTSYALTSVLTAKYMQPLLALGERGSEHPTLPELLRRHGYRTAAFYPPAIFFVDPERFAGFSERHLGFEYVKAMFADVEQQVTMVEDYLRAAPPELPVFTWVHVFEPHEPYDPPPGFARGPSPRERYDGEIAAADAGVGRLIAAFRRARPGATVIVSADHGEEFGEHGGHHHGTTLFDEQTRVPLLWSSPGAVAPRRISAPVDLVDLGTTLLSALGVPREARMRGDDLSGLLAGTEAAAPMHAFASIDGAQMVTDGRLKLVCEPLQCQLFDLVADPGEREDVSAQREQDVTRLRSVLAELATSLPRIEALALDGDGAGGSDGGWPPALSRARMGDVTVSAELPPLLSSARPEVRAEAARALAVFGVGAARATLARLAASDPDASVQAEAAIAALQLGDETQRDRVAEVASSAGPAERVRRAGLALATRGDVRGAGVLLPAALDATLDERERLAALDGLSTLGAHTPGAGGVAKGLLPLLEDVRLRPRVAATLGVLGERSVTAALLRAFAEERYPEARAAEARALMLLGARAQARSGIERYLGMASSVPGGVALLLEAGALKRGARIGADLLADDRVRRGSWSCDELGCMPGTGAELSLPRVAAGSKPRRLSVLAHAEAHGQHVTLANSSHELSRGESELCTTLADPSATTLAITADPGVRVRAFVLVPELPELPPPPKEPWEPAAEPAAEPTEEAAVEPAAGPAVPTP